MITDPDHSFRVGVGRPQFANIARDSIVVLRDQVPWAREDLACEVEAPSRFRCGRWVTKPQFVWRWCALRQHPPDGLTIHEDPRGLCGQSDLLCLKHDSARQQDRRDVRGKIIESDRRSGSRFVKADQSCTAQVCGAG